jgi:hypothetical protein
MGKTLLKLTIFLFLCNLYSQKLYFNKNIIHVNEFLELSVASNGEKILKTSIFPELEGFVKKDSIKAQYTYTVKYQALAPGKYMLPPIKVKVNNQTVSLPKSTITVTPSTHFSNFFKAEEKKEDKKFVDKTVYTTEIIKDKPRDDVFMRLYHDKDIAYIGEAILVNISIYILEKKADRFEFIEFEESYKALTKNFKPQNCLEEVIPIEKIENEFVSINGVKYLKYKLYESLLYPINEKSLVFKELSFPILKSKLLGLKKERIDIKCPSESIKIKKIPSQQNKGMVNVGQFTLYETISKTHINAGEGINYSFKIQGTGNIRNLSKPNISNTDKGVEIYESKFIIGSKKENGILSGSINFNYHITSAHPGKVALSDYIFWVYFDPTLNRFDTLKSRIVLTVKGDQANNKMIAANQSDKFYEMVSTQSGKLRNANSNDQFKKWANIGFIVMLSFTLLFIFRGRKNKIR